MPVDFESYVLSSSPPGFEVNFIVNDHYLRPNVSHHNRRSSRFGKQATWQEINASLAEGDEIDDEVEQAQICRSDITSEKALHRISMWDKHYRWDPETAKCDCPASHAVGIGKRKISFADELGKQLEAIHIMEESSDMPPSLHCDPTTSLCLESAEVITTPKLTINFQQPASDYVSFRNTIDTKFVSLENVIIRNYTVVGTIRVKNISFEKVVSVRYTLNNWSTFSDVQASYVPNGICDDIFSTFSFSLECPSYLMSGTKLLFAVRYVACGGQEFWDSNNGDNYEVTYVARNNDSQASAGHLNFFAGSSSDSLWTEFSGWSGINSESPYW